MKKHIDLRPAGINLKLKMEFPLNILFTKYLFYLIKYIVVIIKVSKKLKLQLSINTTLVLFSTLRLDIIILERPGIHRRKIKTFIKFFNTDIAKDQLYSGQTVNGSSF